MAMLTTTKTKKTAIGLRKTVTNTLEEQTTLAYELLKKAVATKQIKDITQAKEQYIRKVSPTLQTALDNTVFMEIKRSTKTAQTLDKYILQFAIGYSAANEMLHSIFLNQKDALQENTEELPNIHENKIIDAIKNKNISYIRIKKLASSAVKAGKAALILHALEYTRNYM